MNEDHDPIKDLMARLRDEPPARAVSRIQQGLPAKVLARVRDAQETRHGLTWFWRGAMIFAPIAAGCVAAAMGSFSALSQETLAAPESAWWTLRLLF